MRRLLPLVAVLALTACASTAPSRPMNLPLVRYTQWERLKPELNAWKFGEYNSLAEVNAYVNKFPFHTDQENYGVSDYWASPHLFFQRGGDCEDYVIAKYVLALQNGLTTPEDAHIILVQDRYRNLPHALLIVHGLVYDNQNPAILSENDSDVQMRYEFLVEVKK